MIQILGVAGLAAYPLYCVARTIARHRDARSERYHAAIKPQIEQHTPAGMQVDPWDVGR